MTPHQADAATLRAIAERCQVRGEDGVAALLLYTASLIEDGVPVPRDLVDDTLTAIKAERED